LPVQTAAGNGWYQYQYIILLKTKRQAGTEKNSRSRDQRRPDPDWKCGPVFDMMIVRGTTGLSGGRAPAGSEPAGNVMKMMTVLKKYALLMVKSMLILTLFGGCSPRESKDGDSSESATTGPTTGKIDYRQEMRDFVQGISAYMKGVRPGFAVIPQNGENLVFSGSKVNQDYLNAVDGIGREDFLYGFSRDDVATPEQERSAILSFLDIFKAGGKRILITDYCSSAEKVRDSYATNQKYGFLSFAADQRELNSVPSIPNPIFNDNPDAVHNLADARNFLYIINPERFASKRSFLEAIAKTNYDLVIMDVFFDDSALTAADLALVKKKSSGAARLAVGYMSIGEAETYRYYWNSAWIKNPPPWLGSENPDWSGNYKVEYWDPAWQKIICGGSRSYAGRILQAGFDGVYLDLVDAYEYYEQR
jgi:cysteinyl-tRNA synthetase, unknown class